MQNSINFSIITNNLIIIDDRVIFKTLIISSSINFSIKSINKKSFNLNLETNTSFIKTQSISFRNKLISKEFDEIHHSRPPNTSIQRRSLSSLDKSSIYFLKVDEINKPIYISQNKIRNLSYNTFNVSNQEKLNFNDFLKPDVILDTIEASSIKKAKSRLKSGESLSDHLGANANILFYFKFF